MLKSEKFFGKRDNAEGGDAFASQPPVPAQPAPAPVARAVPPSIAAAGASSAGSQALGSNEIRSKLTVGPNIKLKGVEITDCDTLVVEGRVEATINSRVIQISEKGAFLGNAEFDIAEIRGEFEGELTVRQKLVVYTTGKVTGKIRYGKLVIEEGGQIAGDIQLMSAQQPASKGLSVAHSN